MQITDFIIDPNSSVIDAMKQIDQNANGIVYICSNMKLIGVLTDGDIRRYILKNGDLKCPVSEIGNKDPKYLTLEEENKANTIMRKYKIRSIPILNTSSEIVKLCFLEDSAEKNKPQLKVPVAIMAGGKGTRLYPYTQILPKPLIPIGEKTITEHIMDHFLAYGCTHFDMIVNYKKNFIKSYFLDNEITRDISFIDEKEFMGTGGGLKLLEGRYSSTFFMTNCDILVEEDYGEILNFHRDNKNLVTMICAVKQTTIPYGTVDVSECGQVLRLNEKPELSFITNTGFYILEPDFLRKIPSNTFIHITDLIQKCVDQGERVGVYPIAEEHWLDMGQLEELERMKAHLNV
ncbi:sugar phosphate nucleotidyltransferase [Hungatella hathewayi]|uniref:CBS domain-containing protein n=1 Tax=Hungatella hathewayi WAL-18680 TaxID=742737 RepID=G5IB35_9FIRM|nr:sugar phosphate nucleotidyltransferase [Hungatella hathewayi]EHI61350.1 hypothetical protein HMPREF9473_00712 [ [Hungatella hathewayi WAL-18680]